ncbi:hypothetical protein EB118_03055 [bacterium]|nr:hypothetical protein [bacterium]NDC93943.1 hypothetical protein [bacterium]NDD83438.1 hypothetical protein [bacterium]NDG29063.1 hypothetical protein [bacterium]
MSKKQLEVENQALRQKVQELEDELKELNENTVIASMNDMRDRYNDMVSTSVCLHRFNNVKTHYKQNFAMCKTIENISSLLFDKLMYMVIYTDQVKNELSDFDRIRKDIRSVRDRVQLILELLERTDELEYDMCDNEYCEYRENT